MKKLFQNYNFEFSKSELKFLVTIVKGVLKQLNDSPEHKAMRSIYEKILEKLNSGEESVKFTKQEKFTLKEQIEGNLKMFNKQIKKAWFFKKWIYKSMITQYENLLENHFKS